MSSSKRRMTPFGRFFIAMLFIVPTAFIASSYYNGEDPINKIKTWFGQTSPEKAGKDKPIESNTKNKTTKNLDNNTLKSLKERMLSLEQGSKLKDEKIQYLEKRMTDLEQRLSQLSSN